MARVTRRLLPAQRAQLDKALDMCQGEFTIEDILPHVSEELRAFLVAHPNVGGAYMSGASKRGLIEATPEWERATHAAAHARKITRWRKP